MLPLSRSSFLAVAALVAGSTADGILDYAPSINGACPDVSTAPLVRTFSPQNQSLHAREAAYVSTRQQSVLPDNWKTWLGDGSGIGYNLSAFENNWPKISISVSGGGYRAAQYGAGVMSAIDARNDSAKAAGTGGLLQVASYWSGLSGGSWLTGSLYMNDWPKVEDMVFGGNGLSGWMLDLALATPDGPNIFNDENSAWYGSLIQSVVAKGKVGLDTSLTDTWARMIAYHFLNGTTRDNFFTNDTGHGAGQLWSRIITQPTWQQHIPPFPIVTIDSRPVNSNATTTLDLKPIVYEVTPLEFGSWDPDLSAMVNLSYAGTNLKEGKPDNDSACVTRFDQACFVMGTSASLFNQMFDTAHNTLDGLDGSSSQGLLFALGQQVQQVRNISDDVSSWPNPFQGLASSTFEDSFSDRLELIDGGSNLENIPIGPMFVKARGMDLIVAVDSSFDDPTNTWPNGTSFIATSQRLSSFLQSSHQQFPPIPNSTADFVSTGVNRRPTFFGCDPTQTPPEWPLVLYLPNSPPYNGDAPVTNTDTFKLSYTLKHTRLFIDQVHNNTLAGFTPNSNSADANWGKCLQCGAVDRARYKLSPAPARSDFCAQCFKQYCYDPHAPPSQSELPGRNLVFEDPDPQGAAKVGGFLSREKGPIIGGTVGAAALIAALTGGLLWHNRRKRKAAYRQINQLHADGGEEVWQMDEVVVEEAPHAHAQAGAGYRDDAPYDPQVWTAPATGAAAPGATAAHANP
ncbi:phospholipase B [Dentipellis sp. KUC8613]|nr:phospholipase B [Dentipellis sp. KUC8613]